MKKVHTLRDMKFWGLVDSKGILAKNESGISPLLYKKKKLARIEQREEETVVKVTLTYEVKS